jgi:hypothetical protein
MNRATDRVGWLVLPLAAAVAGCAEGPGDPCAGVACSMRGFCMVEHASAHCACLVGYHPSGLECLANEAGDPCAGVDCSGHGACRRADDRPTCDCDPGFHHLAVGDPRCEELACDLLCLPDEAADADVQEEVEGDAPDGADADLPDEVGVDLPDETDVDLPDGADVLLDDLGPPEAPLDAEAEGCETDVLADPSNCGSCGSPCAAAAHVACNSGSCGCENLWGDCNATMTDGCEASLDRDSRCGACFRACAPPCTCDGGTCRYMGSAC